MTLLAISELAKALGGEIRTGWALPVSEAPRKLRGQFLEQLVMVCDQRGCHVARMAVVGELMAESAACAVLRLGDLENILEARLSRELSLVAG